MNDLHDRFRAAQATAKAIFWRPQSTPAAMFRNLAAYAEEHDLRIVGVDRPGIGWSTAHVYDDLLGWTDDLAVLADTIGVRDFHAIGLSGGGPYALAAAAAMPERVRGVDGGRDDAVLEAERGVTDAVVLEPEARHAEPAGERGRLDQRREPAVG